MAEDDRSSNGTPPRRNAPAAPPAGQRRGGRPRGRRVRFDLIALLALTALLVLAGVTLGVVWGVNAVRARVASASATPGASEATTSAAASGSATAQPSATAAGQLSAAASQAATTSSAEATWAPGPDGQLVRKVAIYKSVPAPKGLAISPDNSEVWVTALVTKPSIGIYATRTGKKLGSVDLGKSGAVEVIFNKDGSKAYASQMQTHRVYEIDTRTREVLRKFDTGSPWTKVVLLSPDETKLYAANWSGDDVSEIDLASGKLVRRIKTADTPRGLFITADGSKMYVACFGEQTLKGVIQVFDLADAKPKGKTIGRGRAMRHMVADETAGKLFTSDLGANCIWVTDLATNETTLFAKTDHKPNTIDISPDGKVLFVSNRGENNPKSYYIPGPEWGSILLLDTKTGKPLDAIVGGNQCTALDLSADGTVLAFSDFLDGKLRIYDVPPSSVLLAGKGGSYQPHLRKVRKDGKLLVVKTSGSASD